MPVIVIFGSSSCEPESLEYNTAENLGRLLAKNGFDIATGGYSGVMEAALKGASEYNVNRIGITSDYFTERQRNEYIREEIIADNYFNRLLALINIADAYVVLPGGSGTLLEFTLAWALKERDIIKNKPLICFGEQWNEVLEIIKFYSVGTNDSSINLLHASDPIDVTDYLFKFFN